MLWGFGILQQCWGNLKEHSIPSNEPNAGNEQPMCTGTKLIVSWGPPGVKSLVFHYLWSLWKPLPKLLMRKNAKSHIIRFHHNYCSQHTLTKCNLALLRCLCCGVLGSCSNVGGNLQEHSIPSNEPNAGNEQPMCTGTKLIVSWGPPGVKSLVFHYLWSL